MDEVVEEGVGVVTKVAVDGVGPASPNSLALVVGGGLMTSEERCEDVERRPGGDRNEDVESDRP